MRTLTTPTQSRSPRISTAPGARFCAVFNFRFGNASPQVTNDILRAVASLIWAGVGKLLQSRGLAVDPLGVHGLAVRRNTRNT
jgi:hypothetical protein